MRLSNKKILVTGGAGFLGRYVVSELHRHGAGEIIVPRSAQYDLLDRNVCQKLTRNVDIVIHLAARIGGIGFISDHPGEVFYNNLIMGVELMEAARRSGTGKFVSVGTVCEYPKYPPLPFKESTLWDGYPDESTASYGLAKKMLIVQGRAYKDQYNFNAIHLLPVNLYGPKDNFDRVSSHVIPALIRKIIEARDQNKPYVEVWGTGRATREFLYVEDAARGIVLATQKYDDASPVNLGSGIEITIRETAELIMKITRYNGEIRWNTSKPDGQPRRQVDVSRAKKLFGFVAQISFEAGLRKTIDWYEKNKKRN